MAKLGYMRISTKIQDNALQLDALQKYGCDKIFSDKIGGSKIKRPGLDACVGELKSGDTLVVWRLDRLGRRLSHLSAMFDDMQQKKIGFVSIMDNFDTSTVAGRGMLGIMMVFAQMERELNSERVVAGLAVRRSEGGKLGPPFKIPAEARKSIMDMDAAGVSQTAIARTLRISQSTVSNVIRRGGL